MMLADQGADVVKVESSRLGDIMRFLGTSKGRMTGIFADNDRGRGRGRRRPRTATGADLVPPLVTAPTC